MIHNKFQYAFAAVLVTTASLGHTQDVKANSPSGYYYCGTHNGSPATVFQNDSAPNGNAIFEWTSWASGSDWTPQRRCEVGSSNIERNRALGKMQYLVPGKINYTRRDGTTGTAAVICASAIPGNGVKQCQDSEILVTLNPQQTDPNDLQSYNWVMSYIQAKNKDANLPPGGVSPLPMLKRRDGGHIISVSNLINNAPRTPPSRNPQPPVRPNPPSARPVCGVLGCNY